jgi:hypothetical protein
VIPIAIKVFSGVDRDKKLDYYEDGEVEKSNEGMNDVHVAFLPSNKMIVY